MIYSRRKHVRIAIRPRRKNDNIKNQDLQKTMIYNIPGAKSIYDDLSKRFEKSTSESEETAAETETR